MVALMLGIITDYSIFFLTGMQRRLRLGESDHDAARSAVREYLPIVVTAGLTVACGVAALVVARSGLFRELGPGLAVTVLVGLLVAVLLGARAAGCARASGALAELDTSRTRRSAVGGRARRDQLFGAGFPADHAGERSAAGCDGGGGRRAGPRIGGGAVAGAAGRGGADRVTAR